MVSVSHIELESTAPPDSLATESMSSLQIRKIGAATWPRSQTVRLWTIVRNGIGSPFPVRLAYVFYLEGSDLVTISGLLVNGSLHPFQGLFQLQLRKL